ncbi:hypothetical protein B0H12DRAFT_1079903 [Mycena haematopus]|nr:hypothetical protein B0H12DRAFT_1079903 [Mycena haematopus]
MVPGSNREFMTLEARAIDDAHEFQVPRAVVVEVLERIEDGSRNPKVAVAHASDPGACEACLPPPSGQVSTVQFRSIRIEHGIFDTIKIQKKSHKSRKKYFRNKKKMSYSARKRARLAAKKRRADEKAESRETVLRSWREMEQVPVHGTKSFQRLVRRIKGRQDATRKILLRCWYSTPWDAGSNTLLQGVTNT